MSPRWIGFAAALAVLLGTAAPSHADSPPTVPLSCTVAGVTGSATLSATATVQAPSSLTPGQSFSPQIQIALAFPAALYTNLAGLGASSTTITVSAFSVQTTGATPAQQNWFATSDAETVPTTGGPPSVNFPAQPKTVGPYAVTAAAGGSVVFALSPTTGSVVASATAGSLNLQITCTASGSVPALATIPVVAPMQAVTTTTSTTTTSTSSAAVNHPAPPPTVDHAATNVHPRVDGRPRNPLALAVACPAAKPMCVGTVLVRTAFAVRLATGRRRGRVRSKLTLGTVSFSVRGGTSQVLRIKLTPMARRTLARYRLLRANVEVKAHDPSGDPGVVTIQAVLAA